MGSEQTATVGAVPRRRAGAQRNLGVRLEAAKAVFASDGVDAPAKEIADRWSK
jgi:hypothetical protein